MTLFRWLKRLTLIAFVIVSLPCIAFTAFMLWGFHPTIALGRGISDLTYQDQIHYLILVDQMGSNEALDRWRANGGVLNVSVADGGDDCAMASPALDQALSRAWAFSNITRGTNGCDSLHR